MMTEVHIIVEINLMPVSRPVAARGSIEDWRHRAINQSVAESAAEMVKSVQWKWLMEISKKSICSSR